MDFKSRILITAVAVYILRNLLWHILNTKCCISSSRREDTRWRVMRCTALRVAMICQAFGFDKKFDKSKLVEFLCLEYKNATYRFSHFTVSITQFSVVILEITQA